MKAYYYVISNLPCTFYNDQPDPGCWGPYRSEEDAKWGSHRQLGYRQESYIAERDVDNPDFDHPVECILPPKVADEEGEEFQASSSARLFEYLG